MATRLLVKLRPDSALRVVAARASIEPLYREPAAPAALAGAPEPRWFIAHVADAPDASAGLPWDTAHAHVAAQLGVAEDDVIFAEPDLVHDIFRDPGETPAGVTMAVGADCSLVGQDATHGKVVGPDAFAWHLDAQHSQLAQARGLVTFTSPRTRIAHIDTGYWRAHETVPAHVLRERERSFVDGDADGHSAEDPGGGGMLDNSGHGTGTLGILAGGAASVGGGTVIGGAPDADILPVRVADRVVLLRTSALARGFRYAAEERCDVVTLSMGGLPSQAWAEAVDAAYEAGVCICAAAGNHIGALPPRTLVYPARYPRVIAVCGVMADGSPYADLQGSTLEGSHGPESAMRFALSAYTPNIPWARYGCTTAVRRNGEGTSAATPQVAAAAALWIERYKDSLPRDWRRVEAVRHALFTSAKWRTRPDFFGRGVVQARAALDVAPVLDLPKSEASKSSFAFLRLITGIGIAEPPPRERMFNLELAQRWLLNPELSALVADPEGTATVSERQLLRIMEAVIEDQGASLALRKHVAARFGLVSGQPARRTRRSKRVVPAKAAACSEEPRVTDPPVRRIRVYAVDPSFSTRLDAVQINEVTATVRWEPLKPGPSGAYLEVEDVDATGHRYQPVNLDAPALLAQDGWAPSEGNPQFHQQMVYAVSMRTIELFEQALGRPVLWRPRPNAAKPADDSEFVPQLLVRPHELQQANAFYSPDRVALLFGYFEADASDPGDHVAGSRVYACLSHDIVAHETTHAILDGIHRRFQEPSNPDVLAFHEAFADIVALMQHFTIPEILRDQVARTRGDFTAASMLGSLAIQFGQATGTHGGLRDAIGRMENGVWKRFAPDPQELARRMLPHDRGAILVAAVFDAFLACYQARIADLLRLATNGTGVLPSGALHPDLVTRLADEAAKTARQVLTMCIRAIDYLPPVDVTFFEYLRALITADLDLVSDDRFNYRVAFVEAFRRRGIYPIDLAGGNPADDTPRTLSVDTLRWRGIDFAGMSPRLRKAVDAAYEDVIDDLREYANQTLYISNREVLFTAAREERKRVHRSLKRAIGRVPKFAEQLGLDPKRPFEVHQMHSAIRIGSDGQPSPQVIVRLLQATPLPRALGGTFRGGSTVIVDLTVPKVAYAIVKHVNSVQRQERALAFAADVNRHPLHSLIYRPDRKEPFAALHALGNTVRKV